MTALIDSHCHLDAPEFDVDREQVVQAASAAGLDGIVVPAYVSARWQSLLSWTRAHNASIGSDTLTTDTLTLCPALGLHPIYLAAHDDSALNLLADLLSSSPDVVAVGEIGLDRFLPELTTDTAWARQVALFEAQLVLAAQHELPVIIHARRCHAHIVASLKRVKHRTGGIVHAFSGSIEEAQQYLQLGLHLGMGGALTYPHSARLRAVASALPLSAFVLETDAPDMITYAQHPRIVDARTQQPVAQTKSRGESPRVRNSPAFLPEVLATFAELRPESPAELAVAFRRNTVAALRLPLSISS